MFSYVRTELGHPSTSVYVISISNLKIHLYRLIEAVDPPNAHM